MTKAIMENYINTVYLDYLFEVTGNKDFVSILIRLCYNAFNCRRLYPYTKSNIYEVFIPRGLTPVCQPLDININKIFKDEMKKLYLNRRANLINNQTRVSRQNVVEWCGTCREHPSVISSKIIKETFLEAGITISLKGEEDYKVKIFDRIKAIMPDNIIENEKNNDKLIDINKNNIIDEL